MEPQRHAQRKRKEATSPLRVREGKARKAKGHKVPATKRKELNMSTKTATKAVASSGNALSTKEVAKALKTDAKTLRKFLRDQGSAVGRGARYEFTKRDVQGLTRRFKAWSAGE